MAEDLTVSLFTPVMKNLWHRGRVVDLVAREQPFWSLVPKRTDFVGEDQKVTVKYTYPQGVSSTFSNAQSNTYAGREKRFSVTRSTTHGVVTLDTEVIEASKNDMGALYRAFDDRVESLMTRLIHDTGRKLMGNGGCALARVAASSAFSTTTCTLLNTRDARFFEVGMTVTAGTTDGSTSGTKRSGTATITAVDRINGTLTASANWTTAITGAANSDYLFLDGDTDSNNLGLGFKGIQAWIPSTVPTSGDSFFGVDRSADPERLAGRTASYTSEPIETAIMREAAYLAEAGASPDIVIVSPKSWANLNVSLGSRVMYDEAKGSGEGFAKYGFPAIKIGSEGGMLKVISDRNAPDARAFILSMNSWCFHTLGEAPKIADDDGLKSIRVYNDDAIEVRARVRGQLWCNAPGHNSNIAIAT